MTEKTIVNMPYVADPSLSIAHKSYNVAIRENNGVDTLYIPQELSDYVEKIFGTNPKEVTLLHIFLQEISWVEDPDNYFKSAFDEFETILKKYAPHDRYWTDGHPDAAKGGAWPKEGPVVK